jgi:hypothetical protein
MELDQYPRKAYKTRLDSEIKSKERYDWHNIVTQYHERSLTYASDFLPALSGIVTRLQTLGAGDYLAGLWRENLVDELLWSREINELGLNAIFIRAKPYRAPTWSWASLCRYNRNQYEHSLDHHSFIFWPNYDQYQQFDRQIGRIIQAECAPSGRDLNGAVKSGKITIEAKMLSIVCQKNLPDGRSIARLHDGAQFTCPEDAFEHTFETFFDLTMEDYSDSKLYGLFIGSTVTQPRGPNHHTVEIHGIILRQAQHTSDSYERVGYCAMRFWVLHPQNRSQEGYDASVDKALTFLSHVHETRVTIV